MTRTEHEVCAILLVGDHNWRQGPLWPALCAFFLGRREVMNTYLGDRATVAWWREQPFLIRIRSTR